MKLNESIFESRFHYTEGINNYSLSDFEDEIEQVFTLSTDVIEGSIFILPDGMFLSPSNERNPKTRAMHMDLVDSDGSDGLSPACRNFIDKCMQECFVEANSKRNERSLRLYNIPITNDQWYSIYDWVDFMIDKGYKDFELDWENSSGMMNWCRIDLTSMDTDKIIKEIKMLYKIKTTYQESFSI